MIEDHFGWANATWQMVYNKGKFIKTVTPPLPVPGFLQGPLFSLLASRVGKQAQAQGMARHAKPEVEKFGLDDLRAVSTHLGRRSVAFINGSL